MLRPREEPMSAINDFLLRHQLRIAANPCISPDFCLDWPALRAQVMDPRPGGLTRFPASRFVTAVGSFELAQNDQGDHAWIAEGAEGVTQARLAEALEQGIALPRTPGVHCAFPATWANLLRIKNLAQEHDPGCTIFPVARGTLAHSSLGIGARMTTLHWPAVEWAMAQLGLSMTANQNSIPRELVYDVDAMLAGTLDSVPFPFIGGNVPEGHQGQSVEGMSHGAVLSKLKTGFHQRRIPWGFNADHQPIGGKFDGREDRLVSGCLLSSYITFDLSPELTATVKPADAAAWCAANVPAQLLATVRARVAQAGVALDDRAFAGLIAAVWPAVQKMQRRDAKYAAARAKAFTTDIGRAYFRELSIDELPGLTTPATLASMLALCAALGMTIQYVAPAFGFQKNFPFADNAELERRIAAAWAVCRDFGVSIGFHSGSGKSAENYRLCGRLTGSRLEIKTSGRYTYELGVALSRSRDAGDQALWRAWYDFTRELAAASAFGANDTERTMARQFIVHALTAAERPVEVFSDLATCRAALAALSPDPDHMFWFEYNFLFVLAADGRSDKAALGDHSPAGYAQRARFYAISEEGRLRYAQGVAGYLLFLAETTGMATAAACAQAKRRLDAYDSYAQLLADIAPAGAARAS
jgi:hypothetical protein